MHVIQLRFPRVVWSCLPVFFIIRPQREVGGEEPFHNFVMNQIRICCCYCVPVLSKRIRFRKVIQMKAWQVLNPLQNKPLNRNLREGFYEVLFNCLAAPALSSPLSMHWMNEVQILTCECKFLIIHSMFCSSALLTYQPSVSLWCRVLGNLSL